MTRRHTMGLQRATWTSRSSSFTFLIIILARTLDAFSFGAKGWHFLGLSFHRCWETIEISDGVSESFLCQRGIRLAWGLIALSIASCA
jgi:hypothetical protein